MTALPWMPLFPGDELAETAHLSAEEYGAYALLKMALWQHGSLADDDNRLCRITRLTLDRWLTVRPILAPLFADGWRHEKLEQHRVIASNQRQRKSAAGKKGALSRWGERSGDGPANGNANSNRNGTAISSAMGSANADANSLHLQMKNSALEGEVLTRTHIRAREEGLPPIPSVGSKLQAGQWLTDHAGLFPGDHGFDVCVDKMMAKRLTWEDIRSAG